MAEGKWTCQERVGGGFLPGLHRGEESERMRAASHVEAKISERVRLRDGEVDRGFVMVEGKEVDRGR